jgi:hypothetical protein
VSCWCIDRMPSRLDQLTIEHTSREMNRESQTNNAAKRNTRRKLNCTVFQCFFHFLIAMTLSLEQAPNGFRY